MKKNYISALFIGLLLVGCATPSKKYVKLSSLNEEEKMSLTCEQISQEIVSIQNQLNEIGEVSSIDAAAANFGVGMAILRASLGGFNSGDLQVKADVEEQRDAIQKANIRLAEVIELQQEKKCKL